jgi:hypothetical protein
MQMTTHGETGSKLTGVGQTNGPAIGAIGPGDLHTLTYRIDPACLGPAVIYEFGPDFHREWERIAPAGKYGPSYKHLAQALTATAGQPVLIRPSRAADGSVQQVRMFTTQPVDPWILETTFGTFQQLSCGDNRGTLGVQAGQTPPKEMLFDSGGRHRDVMFEIARWLCASVVTQKPFTFDGAEVRYREDTDGNLLAWDRPIEHETPLGHWIATHYLETSVVTLPGTENLYYRLEPRLSRIPGHWSWVGNLWLSHNDRQPLLTVPVGHRRSGEKWQTYYKNHLADILQACQLSPMPVLPEDLKDADPHVFRARMGKPSYHGIGKGVGVRHAFQLQEQLSGRFDQAEPHFTRTPIQLRPRQKESRIAGLDLDPAVLASGTEALRIVCLYATETTRHRMLSALSWYSSSPSALTDVLDDVEVPLTGRVSVVCHHAPELLAHGGRERDLNSVGWIRPEGRLGAVTVVALVETDVMAAQEARRRGDEDAKPVLRRELGKRGVITQFLDSGGDLKNLGKSVDYPADYAVRDLISRAGVLDNRLGRATTALKATQLPLTQSATFVGLHLREVKTPSAKRGTRPKPATVVKLIALHASSDPDVPWTITMYDDELGWTSYRQAAARYYASALGSEHLGYYGDGAIQLRRYVDQALSALPLDRPLVVFVDSVAARVWSGLRHAGHNRQPELVPGATLRHPDLAVVRVATGDNTLRATHRTHVPFNNDSLKPDLPDSALYEHTENDTTIWLLPHKSRIFRAGNFGARVGADHTRWSLPAEKSTLMKDDWHLLSATEISVPRLGSWTPRQLAALTARLCNHPVSWDDRTRYPVPLHLARAVDSEHPGNPAEESST